MAGMTSDLTDAQIEALLSAAEVSLASKTPSAKTGVVATDKQQSLVVTPAHPVTEPAETGREASNGAVDRSELTLRMPQLWKKNKNKKVSQISTSPFSLSRDENPIPTFQNDARRPSVMAANPAPNMILLSHSYTEESTLTPL